jgi:hypothetical protein
MLSIDHRQQLIFLIDFLTIKLWNHINKKEIRNPCRKRHRKLEVSVKDEVVFVPEKLVLCTFLSDRVYDVGDGNGKQTKQHN